MGKLGKFQFPTHSALRLTNPQIIKKAEPIQIQPFA